MVTVDEVVKEAGVAKGTFYFHFEDLEALIAAVADDLIESIDALLQPGRLSLGDPAHRIAFGCCSFIDKALCEPGWASVMARMAAGSSKGAENTRRHLMEDLSQLSEGLQVSMPPELSLEIVVGILLQLTGACAEGRLPWHYRNPAIGAILRAIGLNTEQVKATLAILPPSTKTA